MFSLEAFYKEYDTITHELVINERKFKIMLPRDLTGFINAADVLQDFPLWAKIWPASWVLADYLAGMPAASSKKFIEIGAGVGLVSIVAASFGHRITLTDGSVDALRFARANAFINGCRQLPIMEFDWNQPPFEDNVDYFVASEVTYRKEDWQSLLSLFKKGLKTGGEVILTGEISRIRKDFYRQLEVDFDIALQKKTLRTGKEEFAVFLFRLTLKN
jgi:predicted nicotinamide N-methyase